MQLFAIDIRSLAAFRVGLGLALLADYAYRSLDLSAHYTDAGVLPRDVYADVFSRVSATWSGHLLSGDPWFQGILFVVGACVAAALLLGYRTRVATVLCWVLLVSLHNRQPLVLTGGDLILRLLLFWSMFLPLNAVWSLDQRRAKLDRPAAERSAASLALLVQIGLIYVFAVIFKLLDPAWTELTAIEQTMGVEGVATRLGRKLLDLPEVMRFLTAGTLCLELLLPILAFCPWRTPQLRMGVVPVMWIFHLAIGATMNLGLMEYIMVLAWIPFLPSVFWDKISRNPSRRAQGESRADAIGGRYRPVATLLVLMPLCLVIFDNLASLDRPRFRGGVGSILRFPTQVLALSQEWRLWSTPLTNRYYVFPATLVDGTRVDLHSDMELDWARPSRTSRNNHWWKYQLHVSLPRREKLRPPYAQYLIRSWNSTHAGEERVADVALVMIDASRGGGPIEDMPRHVLYRTVSTD